MKNSLFVLALFASTMFSCSPAMAQTTDEYVKAVGAGISPNWFSPSTLYGTVKVTVLVQDGKATLMHKSSNEAFNEAVLKSANKALDATVTNNIAFDVVYKGSSLINLPSNY